MTYATTDDKGNTIVYSLRIIKCQLDCQQKSYLICNAAIYRCLFIGNINTRNMKQSIIQTCVLERCIKILKIVFVTFLNTMSYDSRTETGTTTIIDKSQTENTTQSVTDTTTFLGKCRQHLILSSLGRNRQIGQTLWAVASLVLFIELSFYSRRSIFTPKTYGHINIWTESIFIDTRFSCGRVRRIQKPVQKQHKSDRATFWK